MSQDEKIDLKNLTQKELLILLNEKVGKMEKDILSKSKVDLDLQLRVNTLETKVKMWAVMGAGIVSLIIKIAEKILS